MKIQYILYVVVYAIVILFVRARKMNTNGTQQRPTRSFGGGRSSTQRERTTFNTTQSASVPISQMQQRPAGTGFPIPILLNNSFGMGKETDDFITSESRKYGRKNFLSRGEHKDIDCQLDERIFGSRHENKDLF